MLVESGMLVGLGTGSTAAEAIRAIGRRMAEDHLDIRGVATSFAAERLARAAGIPLIPLTGRLDLALDGADEVDPELNLIKGRGGAHTREKVVASAADRFVVLADDSKLVERLGSTAPVPVEVVPMAADHVRQAVERLGAEVTLRMAAAKDGPVVSDQGLWILDARVPRIPDPAHLARTLKELPGVLDHGLFVDMADHVILGRSDGSVKVLGEGVAA